MFKQVFIINLLALILSEPISAAQVTGYKQSVSLGCVADNYASNAWSISIANDLAMSATYCIDYCSSLNYQYAGLEYTNVCRCEQSMTNSNFAFSSTPSTACYLPCSGNFAQTCGGVNFVNLYSTGSTATSTPPAVTNVSTSGFTAPLLTSYVGCFVNSVVAANSIWSTVYTIPGMTTNACSVKCALALSWFAVQNGNQCYCGSTPAYLLYSAACTVPCAGDSSIACGGVNSVSVYRQLASATDPVSSNPSVSPVGSYGSTQYLGCLASNMLSSYKPVKILQPVGTIAPVNFTVPNCVSLCTNQGYSYASLESSTRCLCDSALGGISNPALNNISCTTACPGATTTQCGGSGPGVSGPSSIYSNVYYTPVTVRSALKFIGQSNYLGCAVESTTTKVMPYQITSVSADSMTPPACISACSALGLSYSATEAGNLCFCSSTAPTSYWPNALNCMTVCTGDSSSPCGGTVGLQVYYTASIQLPASGAPGTGDSYTDTSGRNVAFLGCYQDTFDTRTLAVPLTFAKNTVTVESCALACAASNFPYSGLEYGQECWCSRTAPSSSLVRSNTLCNMQCGSRANRICGGSLSLYVYLTAGVAITSNLQPFVNIYTGTTVSFLGCYGDTQAVRSLPTAITTIPTANMTPNLCASACSAQLFSYSGTEFGGECWCSNVAPPTTLYTDSSCNSLCRGNSLVWCGGPDRISVYQTAAGAVKGVLATYTDSSSQLVSYYGCVSDNVSGVRTFSYIPTGLNGRTMTPQICQTACSSLGYSFSGTEYASECYCSMSAPSQTLTIPDTNCNMACNGNSALYCGAGWTLSIYRTTLNDRNSAVLNSAIPVFQNVYNGFSYQGCYVDSIYSRVLAVGQLVAINMTPQLCMDQCSSYGYSYAGVEYGAECYCGNALSTSSSATGDNSCQKMACSGDSTVACGAGNRILVYRNSNLQRSILSQFVSTAAAGGNSQTWNYKACWGEPINSRALPNRLKTSGTVQSCLDAGSSGGYNACGLEYGGECWCSNIGSSPPGGQIPEAYCTYKATPCIGDSSRYCGGGYIFAFYSLGTQSYSPL